MLKKMSIQVLLLILALTALSTNVSGEYVPGYNSGYTPSHSTNAPSLSNVPTVVSSMTPSSVPACSIDEFMGKSYRIPYTFPSGCFLPTTPYCFKIDLFQGGMFSLDATDPSCTSRNFKADYTLSTYKQTSGGTSALFEAIDGGYNGHFTVKEDPTVAGMDVRFVKLNPYTRIFELIVLLPSCTSPSAVPSVYPTQTPSMRATVEPTVSQQPSTDFAYAVCGSRNGLCDPKALIAPTDGLFLLRCCSSVRKEGWRKNTGCSVWTRSRLNEKCHFSTTLSEAKQICADNDARLCTRSEVEADCAQDETMNGCLMDNGLIWTNIFVPNIHS